MNVKALGIKLVINIIVVFSIFGIFYDASLVDLFVISIITTAVAYFVGDLFILPRTGNIIASIADLGLAFLTLALLGSILIETDMPVFTASMFAAFFIALTEPLLHVYMKEKGEAAKSKSNPLRSRKLQTEFAEETEAQSISRKDDPRRDPQK